MYPMRGSGRRSTGTAIILAVMAFTASCSSGSSNEGVVSANGVSQRMISAAVGQEVDLTLGTVGPGEYASPPVISAPALRFVDVSYVSPYVPAGPRQLFRFTATAPGRFIISFQHTGHSPAIQDTVDVH
jgi:hypothetical protein